MKITFLNATTYGGAAIAAIRIAESIVPFVSHQELIVSSGDIEKGNQVFIEKPKYYELKSTWFQILEQSYFYVFGKATDRILTLNYFGVFSSKLISLDTDIIHLHWINRGFLALKNLKEIGKLKKAIVWTLHDMSPFTGICSYTGGCNRFMETCGSCKYLKGEGSTDISNRNLLKKQQIYKELNLHIVTCSKWLKEEATKSTVLKGIPIHHIPNPIDVNKFQPIREKKVLRKHYKINNTSRVILFGAAKLDIPRKGFRYFKESLDYLLDQKSDIQIVLVGKGNEDKNYDLKYKTIHLNNISTEEEMVELYNLADICVVPSLQDNFPNMVLESMACGTPVVGFKTGGIPEMVDHKKNGYIAEVKNSQDLAKGIEWTLRNRMVLSKAARKKVVKSYSYDVVGKEYLSLYHSILSTE